MFGFGKKTEREPEYINSALNTPMLNYRTYVMGRLESITVQLVIFAIGGLVGLAFYEGLFKIDGYPTIATYISDAFFFVVVGIIAVKVFVPVYEKTRLEKRATVLSHQFRDMLEALSSSVSSGSNVPGAFKTALEDLKRQYSPDDYIVKEMEEIVGATNQGFGIDAMLRDFADRSGNEDIESFADVFEACYRKGGSMTSVIQQTRIVLVEKMSVADEIQTKLTSNKLQHNVMSVMPIAVVVLLRVTNEAFAANFATMAGVVASTVAIAIFVGSYLYGQKIVDIKV